MSHIKASIRFVKVKTIKRICSKKKKKYFQSYLLNKHTRMGIIL